MKFYLILFFLMFCTFQTQSQSYKFKTSSLSVLEKKANGKWGDWSDLNFTNILVTLDTNKSRFVIYSEVIQLFEIIDYQPISENDTDIVYPFVCKDNNGDDCSLTIITRKNQKGRKQLYVNYDDRVIVYNINSM